MDQLETLELKISKFLRAGVIVSGILMLVGWLSHAVFHDSYAQFKTYQQTNLHSIIQVSLDAHAWGNLISYLGLAILISLPIIRVFLTAFLFMKQKEYLLAGIATFVMIALIISFSLGIEL